MTKPLFFARLKTEHMFEKRRRVIEKWGRQQYIVNIAINGYLTLRQIPGDGSRSSAHAAEKWWGWPFGKKN